MSNEKKEAPRLAGAITAITAERTLLNSGYRMVYPFLSVIARGAGLPLERVTLTVTLRSFLGLLGPIFGAISDRFGRRTAMTIGAGFFVAGGFVAGLVPGFMGLLIGIMVLTMGKLIYDPAMHAFLGDQVPYENRGTAIAVAEMAWSGAFFLGMPFAGWLISQSAWNTPFIVFSALAIPLGIWMWRATPDDPVEVQAKRSRDIRKSLKMILSAKGAIASIMVGLLISLANEVVNIVFGAWLDIEFGMGVLVLGAASSIIGVAEFGGESLVALISDRIGKKFSVMIGISMNIVASILLPLIGHSGTGALIGLFLFFISFEFSLVACIPLVSEILPEERAILLALNITGLSSGRLLGSVLGPMLYQRGIWANTMAAIIFDIAALIFLSRITLENRNERTSEAG